MGVCKNWRHWAEVNGPDYYTDIGTVYLLCHAAEPLGSERHQTMHYAGFAKRGNLARRIRSHRHSNRCHYTAALRKQGIKFKVVRVWPNVTRLKERAVKHRGKAIICPVCNERVRLRGQQKDDPTILPKSKFLDTL